MLCEGCSTLWAKTVTQRSENSLHLQLHSKPQASGSLPHGRVEQLQSTIQLCVGYEGSISEKVP